MNYNLAVLFLSKGSSMNTRNRKVSGFNSFLKISPNYFNKINMTECRIQTSKKRERFAWRLPCFRNQKRHSSERSQLTVLQLFACSTASLKWLRVCCHSRNCYSSVKIWNHQVEGLSHCPGLWSPFLEWKLNITLSETISKYGTECEKENYYGFCWTASNGQ